MNVKVGGNTHLKGSLIAAGEFDKDNTFVDNKNLNFETKTISYENLSNTKYSSNKSIGANVNVGLEKEKSNKPKAGYKASNSLNIEKTKTLATLGQGNITIKDKKNSDEIEVLNRDTKKINKELYSSNTGTKVDAIINPDIKETVKDLKKLKDIVLESGKLIRLSTYGLTKEELNKIEENIRNNPELLKQYLTQEEANNMIAGTNLVVYKKDD